MARWHHGCDGHELGKIQEMVRDRGTWHAAVHGTQRVGHNWMTQQQHTHTYIYIHFYFSKFCQCIYVYMYIYFLYFFVNVVMVGNIYGKKSSTVGV